MFETRKEKFKMKKLKGVSLFAGAGGMDLGLQNAGVDIIWANELDPFATETYRKNIGNHITLGDIVEIPSSKIPNCDILFGGPPCQGFSVAGKMNLEDPRSQLVWEFIRVVRDKTPKVFLMENVKNLVVNGRFVEIRKDLIKTLQSMGYDTEARILNSKEFGVPQSRERAFFIGVQTKLNMNVSSLFPKGDTEKEVTVRDALSPFSGSYEQEGQRCNAKIIPAKNPVMRKSPYAGMIFNGQGRPLNLDRPAITMTASMGGNKTPFIDEKCLKNKNEKNWVEKYHELLKNTGKPLKKVPSFLRRITVTESALLQSFPRDYIFIGSQCNKYRQIGNAVPPKLAQAIGEQVMSELRL